VFDLEKQLPGSESYSSFALSRLNELYPGQPAGAPRLTCGMRGIRFLESRAKGFMRDPPEGAANFGGPRPRPFQRIAFYGQRRFRGDAVASSK
jgi:hypothetical protein